MQTEQPSNAEKQFVMITSDPRASNQDFHWCVKHEVFSNDSERVSRLKEPSLPSSVQNFKHKEPSTNLVPAGITLKVSELVKELIEPFKQLEQNEVNNDDGDQRRAKDSNNMDADIIRSLFYWLTTQDIENTEYGMTSSFLRVSYQLQLLKEKKNNYAAFFSLLCHHAGIPCVIIQGHVKGSKYNTGDKITNELLREWNAVLVNGQWQFVDAFWGSQNISGQCQNTWFLFPNPKDFIYSHFPERKRWQLLKKPIEKEIFEKKACLKPRFFQMGLHLVAGSYRDCQVLIEKGESNMIFQIDPDKEENQEFKCVISRLEADKWTEVTLPQKNISLDFVSKVSTEEDRDDDFDDYDEEKQVDLKYNALSVKVRFPKTGTYKLEILGVETIPRNHAWNQRMELQQFDWVAIYKLKVDWVPDWVVYFPQMPVRGWGRNPYLTKCGLRLHIPVNGIQTCFPGLLDLKFKILPNAPTKNIKLCSISKANKAEGQDAADNDETIDDEDQESRPEPSLDYDKCIVEGNIITLQLNMDVGEQKVTIFAKLNKDEKGEVCNYLITCKELEKQFTVEEIRHTKYKLNHEYESKNIEDLRLAVIEAKKTGICAHKEVRGLYRLAYELLKRMQKYQNSLKNIQVINNSVIVTFKQYNQPPPIIITILRATFILLENHDYKIWEDIRRRFGQVDVKCNMETFQAHKLRESQVKDATKLTEGISINDMIGRAQDVAPFMSWVKVTIEHYSMLKNIRQQPPP